MKIIAINGSPRKSQSRTGQLIKEVLRGAESAGAEVEYFDITKLKIEPCIACDKCHKVGTCVLKDDFSQLLENILLADGLVLGSPVYNYQVTAQLKGWLDRLGNVIHCQRFLGKYGAAVATSGGAGENETADYLESCLKRTGIQSVGALKSGIDEDGPLKEDSPLFEEARVLGKTLVQSITEKKNFPDQQAEIDGLKGFFIYLISKNHNNWNWEYEYIKEKGWL